MIKLKYRFQTLYCIVPITRSLSLFMIEKSYKDLPLADINLYCYFFILFFNMQQHLSTISNKSKKLKKGLRFVGYW